MKKALKIILPVFLVLLLAAGVFFGIKYKSRISKMLSGILDRNRQLKLGEVSKTGDWERVSEDVLKASEKTTVDESLLLINTEYKIQSGRTFDVTEYKDSGVYMNRCIQDAYARLSKTVLERFEQKLYVRSAYRTEAEQQAEIENNGENATSLGASEHQAGLALDVYVPYYAGMGFPDCEAGQWVNAHCWEYGFIIRYPSYGQKETGIGYEPWHLRYVGAPHAEIISEQKITLEKYLTSLKYEKVYQYEDYVIIHTKKNEVPVPPAYEALVISEDHMGGGIYTFYLGK